MEDPLLSLATVLLFSGIAGIAIPIGAGIAYLEEDEVQEEPRNLHGAVIAFGGGILLGAITFELVPIGERALSVPWVVGAVAAGTVVIMLLDEVIKAYGGSKAQMLAMMIDFLPEALAFGALFGGETIEGRAFAVLIALQNLPEAYGSFQEMKTSSEMSNNGILARLAPLGILAPAAAVLGFFSLGGNEAVVGTITLFAAGGILYLVFQDIAPDAFAEGHWLATSTVTAGFLVAFVLTNLFS